MHEREHAIYFGVPCSISLLGRETFLFLCKLASLILNVVQISYSFQSKSWTNEKWKRTATKSWSWKSNSFYRERQGPNCIYFLDFKRNNFTYSLSCATLWTFVVLACCWWLWPCCCCCWACCCCPCWFCACCWCPPWFPCDDTNDTRTNQVTTKTEKDITFVSRVLPNILDIFQLLLWLPEKQMIFN